MAPKPSVAATVQPKAKKIDLGAAASFGKSDNLDINSPTHTAGPPRPPSIAGDLIDDLNDDLFNVRGGEATVADNSQEFGDFSSAFGTTTSSAATHVPSVNNPILGGGGLVGTTSSNDDDFADFSAFESGAAPSATITTTPAFSNIANIPSMPIVGAAAAVPPPQQSQSQSDNLLFMGMPSVNNLMAGGPVNSSSFGGLESLSPVPPMGGGNQQDLLADFGDLNLNQPSIMGAGAPSGEYFGYYLQSMVI